MRRIPLILLFVLLLSLATLAQQTDNSRPQPTPSPESEPQQPSRSSDDDVVRITTNLVQVDAVITDKNGNLITDLRPDEVQIFEDGHQQKITNFAFVNPETSSARPLPSAPPDKNAPPLPPIKMHPEDVRRTIALVVDDLGLSFRSTYDVRNALRKFVDQQMQPGDLVAIIRTSGGMGALQQFMADKRQLYAAIERVRWFLNGRSNVGAFSPIESKLPGEDRLKAADAKQVPNEDVNQFREDVFAVGTLGAISYVVKGMRELPGRKSILLMSDGFKISSADDPERNFRTLLALRRLIDQANRATVVIYTMNATGLQVFGLTAADSTTGRSSEEVERMLSDRRTSAFESQDGLNYLAKETGGIAIHNTNDLSGGIRRVIEDQKSYYLIGYRPDESTFDAKSGSRTFHKLSLKITRPGKFSVRMRNGFYGISEADEKALAVTPRQQLLRALTSPFGAAGVRIRLTTLFANDTKAGSYMRSLLYINANDLTFTDLADGGHKAEFDVVAITFGDNGRVIDQVGQSFTLRARAEEYTRLRRDGFVFFLTVPIKKAGAYQLRAALRDHASTRIGSASQFIDVPDIKKNRLVISGILVNAVETSPTNNAAAPAGGAANQSGPEPSNNPETSRMSINAAIRQLKRGQQLQYSVILYNAKLDKTTAKPQLLTQVRFFRDGALVFTGKEQSFSDASQPDLKRITMIGAVRLGNELIPGEYVLQITVTDPLADEKHRVATQWMDFEIVK
ncbi:MAG TPA: VWA domain-containing protein [Pyrinomonadaceae bacterium]|nr:VWA domain-containing protein [Pyrinomonadaceae bacterium]